MTQSVPNSGLLNALGSGQSPVQQTLNDFYNLGKQAAMNNLNNYTLGFNLVWNNKYGLTSQQVLTALGNNASGIFAQGALLKKVTEEIYPGLITLTAPTGFVLNADGTVAIL